MSLALALRLPSVVINRHKKSGLPLRFASAYNRRALAAVTCTTTQNTLWCRWKCVIGSNNFSSLKINFTGVIHGSSGETNLGNNFTIQQCALEQDAGPAYTTVTFSGQNSVTVTNGTWELLSDAISPSAFSLSNFARGTVFWVRCLLTCPTLGNFPVSTVVSDGNSVTLVYDPVTTGVSSVYGTGAPSYSAGSGGTGPSNYQFPNLFTPILVGVPVDTTGKYVSGVGDSIVYGTGDSQTPGDSGAITGFFGRSLWSAGLTTNPIAGCNFGDYGQSASMWNNLGVNVAPVSTALLNYSNVVVEEFGTNNVQLANSQAIWALAKAAGNKVIRTKLLTETTSTDSWATTINQSKEANFTTPTGDRPIFNAALPAYVGTQIDAFVSFDTSGVLYLVDRDLWAAPGFTADGIHPTSVGHEAMAVVLRPIIASV